MIKRFILAILWGLSCACLFEHSVYAVSQDQLPFDYTDFQRSLLARFMTDYSTPECNLLGQTHDSTASLQFNNYPYITASLQFNSFSGGVLAGENVTINGVLEEIVFVSNESKGRGGTNMDGGGGVFAKTNCSISHNYANLYFVNNRTMSSPLPSDLSKDLHRGGAIYSGARCSIMDNQRVVCFGYNIAMNSGGAIYSNDCILGNNEGPLLFMYNQSLAQYGGAIRCKQIFNLTNNHGVICFIGNRSMGDGAISCTELNITENKDEIYFLNNAAIYSSSAAGGACTATRSKIQDNTSIVWFDSNLCNGSGGACYVTTSFLISDNYRVEFSNNQGTKGGAICSNNGELTLKANRGNILFDNNYEVDSTSNSLYRNAVNGVTTHVFSATKNHVLAFFDPVVSDVAATFSFNPESSDFGTVLFSSVNVPVTMTDSKNYLSTLQGTSELYYGFLAIEDGAVVSVSSLTNEINGKVFPGVVRLGQNGTLQTAASQGGSSSPVIKLINLALNTPSLLKEDSKPAIIKGSATTDSVVISGNLSMINDQNISPYESLDLSHGMTRIALLELIDQDGNQVNVKDLNIEAINETNHYGHLGKWTPYWEEYTVSGTNTEKHRILYANWAPIGYVPNPKFQVNLVANALWESFYIADSNLHEYSVFSKHLGVYGGAKGLIHYQYDRSGVPGFHLKTTGYSVGTYASANQDHRFSLNFGQYFSHMKEQGRLNELSSKNYSIGFKAHSHWFSNLFSTTVSGVYSYGKHVVEHEYKDEGKASTGDFYSNTYGVSVRVGLPVTRVTRKTTVSPFVEMLGVRSTLSSFTEEGDYKRAFSVEHPLYELESPVGVRGKFRTYRFPSSEWEAELAYRPTLYRQRPVVTARLLASNGTWSTKGSPTAHQAISYRLSHKANLSKYLLMILNYQGVLSTTTFCNYLQAGMQLHF